MCVDVSRTQVVCHAALILPHVISTISGTLFGIEEYSSLRLRAHHDPMPPSFSRPHGSCSAQCSAGLGLFLQEPYTMVPNDLCFFFCFFFLCLYYPPFSLQWPSSLYVPVFFVPCLFFEFDGITGLVAWVMGLVFCVQTREIVSSFVARIE